MAWAWTPDEVEEVLAAAERSQLDELPADLRRRWCRYLDCISVQRCGRTFGALLADRPANTEPDCEPCGESRYASKNERTSMSVENVNPKRTVKGRWGKGASGNPAGRPSGSRNQSSLFFEELLSGQGEALIQKGIELSLKGDTRALKHLLGPAPPTAEGTCDRAALAEAHRCQKRVCGPGLSCDRCGRGPHHTGEAESLARILETQMRVVGFEALAQRVAELEKVPTRTQTLEPSDGSTLDWISRNYANQTPDSRTDCGRVS